MTRSAAHAVQASPWSPREAELLEVTLRLLQQEGYDGLTLDAVAATARASKATVYRRWPTKAELVLAAFIEGVRQVAVAPETGTLRGDLMQLAEVCCDQAREHASTMRAVLVEVSRNPALNDVMQHQFLDQRKALFDHVRRDRSRRHYRRPLGCDARLPHFPVHLVGSPSHPPHGSSAC